MSTYFTRQKKDRDYTVVDNTYLRDNRLSWKAIGLFTYLLSLPEDWKIYLAELQTHAKDGRDSLMSAIASLEEYGYIVRVLIDENNKFSGYNYEIIERPVQQTATENPQRKTRSGKPAAENPQLLSTNKPSTEELSTKETKDITSPARVLDVRAIKSAEYLQKQIRQNYPWIKERPREIERWAPDIEKIHRLDGHDWDIIKEVLMWSQNDGFWRKNIQSGETLRKQFDRLLMEIKTQHDNQQRSKVDIV